jgi:uncharacterized protein (DUF2249 family)
MTAVHLDNRGLPPPEPMVRILQALQTLPGDAELVVLMDREPLMLYPELERRGFAWTFGADDLVLTITRAEGI